MPRMTEEEADALDELVTKNPPREYLLSVSTATHKTPSEIISEMVHERAVVSAP
ncbi:hypothetical protein ACYULU_11345 [Breznakiellaceae bacterium SP9]